MKMQTSKHSSPLFPKKTSRFPEKSRARQQQKKGFSTPFAFQVTPHLIKLAKWSDPVRKQFFEDSREFEGDNSENSTYEDPLLEQRYSPVKGLIHKYPTRVLVLMTSICSAYCRFCERKRMVGDPKKGLLDSEDLEKIIAYVQAHLEIREVIFSGGDPVTNSILLKRCLERFGSLSQIKIFRIHTRVPVSDPVRMKMDFLESIRSLSQPVYVGIHFNHPDEITPETVSVCQQLRSAGCILYSHTVFLKEVNDDIDILIRLFERLVEIGVRPYYLLRCEPIRGARHFIIEPEAERAIASELRRRLSGLACPLYVIDVPHGSGKIPVPLDFWPGEPLNFFDFVGSKHSL